MDVAPLLKPALYQAEGAPRRPGRPSLLGGECANCGYVFFPLQPYGCERCGSLRLEPLTLAGSGRLIASARVHIHPGKTREAPFTIGAIALDDGPVVRTLIDEQSAGAQVGARMATVLIPVSDQEGAPRLDLRFAEDR
jgi:uncharacterized OB-fold protein